MNIEISLIIVKFLEISMRRAHREYYALFMATLIRGECVKGSKSVPAFKLFFDKNSLKAGKDFDRLTRSSRMRISRNRGGRKVA